MKEDIYNLNILNGKSLKYVRQRRNPEALIQSELYKRLREKGFFVLLEYKVFCSEFNLFARLDLAVVHNDEIFSIIECKKKYPANRDRFIQSTQYRKLKSLKAPVFYCFGWGDIESTVNKICEIYNCNYLKRGN